MTRRSSRYGRSASSRRGASTGRRGFSVVEVLFALVLMSIAIIGMGGMLVQAARTATQSSARSARAAVETQQLNRLAALPYDMLERQVGCVTVSAEPLPHIRCIALTTVGGGTGAKQLRLIITPLNPLVRPDTTYLTRSMGQTANPLAT